MRKNGKQVVSSRHKPSEGVIEDTDLSTSAFSIVGIGASAGGLEAFTALLLHLPADTGMAFVLVQHLSPTHKSMLTEILSKKSAMPITEVTDRMRITPNHVYVIPPNTCMNIVDGFLHLIERPEEFNSQNLPIDFFLSSLAKYQKDKAIAVILSGTASDGSRGVKIVKGYGGITFAQNETAKFDMMPKNAVATGAVDFVQSPEGIAKELIRLSRHPYHSSESTIDEVIPETDSFRQVLVLLRKASGIDFLNYKPATIKRRILRRMMLSRVDSIKNYVSYLIENPKELQTLSQEVFITVTRFFRDPEIFQALQHDVFSNLLKARPPAESIRIWTTGCSTGEEAYSLAINLIEFLEKEDKADIPIQIFATDILDSSIVHARLGIYADNIANDVSPERLKKFFRKIDKGYQINKSVRDVCVFAKQNITADPPFSRLDLISCRNLLIYLDAAAQKRIMPILHYALNPVGFLLLGQSESVVAFTELFSVVNRKAKIYSKKSFVQTPVLSLPRASSPKVSASQMPASQPDVPSLADIQKEADRIILKSVRQSGVVANERMDVIQFRGDTSRYLKHVSGAASLNLLKLAQEGLVAKIREAMHQVTEKEAPFQTEPFWMSRDSSSVEVSIKVKVTPFRVPQKSQRFFLIIFEESDSVPSPKPRNEREIKRGKDKAAPLVKDLERELESTRENLQGVIDDKEAANEELQAANEEMQSLNEEFQSANEELESAKEELQATNEEITTLNDELQGRNIQLADLNDDLMNLMESINLPLITVDRDLKIRRFTPASEKVFRLIPGDIGRPISDIHSDIDLQGLGVLLLQTMTANAVREVELRSHQGQWYKVAIHPYKTADNRIDGAVVTFFDVTKIKAYGLYREAIFATLRHPLLILDVALGVKSANKVFYETFKVGPDETIGRLIFSLGTGQWDIPALRGFLEGSSRNKRSVLDYEVKHDFPHIGQRTMLLNARQIESDDDGKDSILITIEDVTDRKHVEIEKAILETVEGEQRRIGQDLHDGLCQQLTGIALIAKALAKKLAEEAPDESADAAEITELINRSIEQTRDLARGLAPVEIEGAGFAPALQKFADTTERLYKVFCVFAHDNSAESQGRYAPGLATHLYRIVQEAVNNAIEHGKAKRVVIALVVGKDRSTLTIQNDGIEFGDQDEKSAGPGLGLRSMRYRSRVIGGQLTVGRGVDGGTIVTCSFPTPPPLPAGV